ncbi:rhodanese-like protein [Sulfuricella denitrificans skB26]|uniref:Rhodanese-like protein n=1 Tax=Sulfuricella denitrificans (strain DSM 22764 / NBRC 105220 / skB26) TaxID=1163617 RepID=S6AG75_SULDS|nr:rhodanese-like domain-containing protein [Sulfuricella denitrificans]BAN34986.1 rhodanese-like protein [Sulfuricella denitrificans skB26]
MNLKLHNLGLTLVLSLFIALPTVSWLTPAHAEQVKAKEGWYNKLVDIEFVKQNVDIPPKKDVMLIDSRPAARQYDPGHIPGALSIPDSKFDQMAGSLPQDKSTLLIFYCGGVECMLSHNSAFKAEKLGYTNIRVYADGSPDWAAKGTGQAVSAAYIKKLQDEKANFMLIDARPKRTFDKGAIPGAVNISDSEFDKHVDKLPADKAASLIYYCGGLECVLSVKSAEKARKLGYTDVKTYVEGYPEWAKLYGEAVVPTVASGAGETAKAAASIEAGKEKGSISVASFERIMKENPDSLLLVDVRDAKEFKAGTVKGAINISIGDLEKKISILPKDKPIVFLCGTGARSGEAYDTAKLLRSELQVYFIDAEMKFNADGTFSIKERGK